MKLYQNIIIIALAMLCYSCEKIQSLNDGTIENEILSASGNIAKVSSNPGAQQSSFGNFIDVYSGRIFLENEVNENFNNIDLQFRYSNINGNQFHTTDALIPALDRRSEMMVYGWPFKNRAILYLLDAPTAQEIETFKSINNRESLNSFYQSVANKVGGAGEKSLRNIRKNSIVLFKSSSKNITSVIWVAEIASSATERIMMSIKTDNSVRYIVPKQSTQFVKNSKPADTMILSIGSPNADENFVDLLNRRIYKQLTLPEGNLSKITFTHTYSDVLNRFSFFNTVSDHSKTNYLPSFNSYLNTFPALERRATRFYSLHLAPGSADFGAFYQGAGNAFNDIANNNVDLANYKDRLLAAASGYWQHVTSTNKDQVFLVNDAQNNQQGLIHIVDLNLVTRTMTIAIKYTVAE